MDCRENGRHHRRWTAEERAIPADLRRRSLVGTVPSIMDLQTGQSTTVLMPISSGSLAAGARGSRTTARPWPRREISGSHEGPRRAGSADGSIPPRRRLSMRREDRGLCCCGIPRCHACDPQLPDREQRDSVVASMGSAGVFALFERGRAAGDVCLGRFGAAADLHGQHRWERIAPGKPRCGGRGNGGDVGRWQGGVVPSPARHVSTR